MHGSSFIFIAMRRAAAPQLRRGGAGGAVRRQHARVARARRVPGGPSRRVEQPVRPRTREYPLKSRARSREYSGRPSCLDPHSQSRAQCSAPNPMHARSHTRTQPAPGRGGVFQLRLHVRRVGQHVRRRCARRRADARGWWRSAPPLRRASRLSQVPCPMGFTPSGVRASGYVCIRVLCIGVVMMGDKPARLRPSRVCRCAP